MFPKLWTTLSSLTNYFDYLIRVITYLLFSVFFMGINGKKAWSLDISVNVTIFGLLLAMKISGSLSYKTLGNTGEVYLPFSQKTAYRNPYFTEFWSTSQCAWELCKNVHQNLSAGTLKFLH